MRTTTPAEQSLINDSALGDGLGPFGAVEAAGAAQPVEQHPPDIDGFEALDSGLATDADAPGFGSPRHEFVPVDQDDEWPAPHRPAPREFRISFMTAALVLLACLTAGAVTAAYVFQERLTPVTARPSASR